MSARGNALDHLGTAWASLLHDDPILQAGSCPRHCGQALPLPAENSCPQKTKGWLVLPRISQITAPHLSSPIYTQLGGVAAGLIPGFGIPRTFRQKVPWLWQALPSAPLPAFIWCGSKQEQTASAKGLYLCWQETVKVRRQQGKSVLSKSKLQ